VTQAGRVTIGAHDHSGRLQGPVLWGVVWGGIQAASPLALWWLDPSTVYALGLVLIAAVYIGFAVTDGGALGPDHPMRAVS